MLPQATVLGMCPFIFRLTRKLQLPKPIGAVDIDGIAPTESLARHEFWCLESPTCLDTFQQEKTCTTLKLNVISNRDYGPHARVLQRDGGFRECRLIELSRSFKSSRIVGRSFKEKIGFGLRAGTTSCQQYPSRGGCSISSRSSE